MNLSPLRILPVLIALLVSGCASRRPALSDLGRHSFKITTASAGAQTAFNRGLTLAYAFSHKAAEDEFRRAAQLDPDSAMSWWGVALVNGPHINFPMVPPDRARIAWDALAKAKALAPNAGDLERDLIAALEKRYADPQPEDRSPLDRAYAEAMRGVWIAHPENADVGTLYAEALMDLHPWDFWKQTGDAQPWTADILSVLSQTLKLNPDHPGAAHLYIHAVEASPHPELALPPADRLRKLVPGASHLVHMPSHIYARVGQWKDAAGANERAMIADDAYRAAFAKPGFYAMYMAHNTHFLAYVAMMRGRSEEAIRLARQLVAQVPEEFLRDYGPVADGYMIFVSEALMRFGRWEEILVEPKPRPGLPLSLAMWHFTRAVALTVLDRMEEARREQAAFHTAAEAVPAGATFGTNVAKDLLAIAADVLAGEMAAKSGNYDEAVSRLRAAIKIEDTLRYDEPPDWIQPVRHTLGAVLLRAGRPGEAEAVYREDLAKYPNNGWSLFGLGRSLSKQGRDAEARRAETRFRKAWRDADFKLKATCLCQPAT